MRRILMFMLGLLMISSQLLAQNRTITGRVTDAQGAPVANASVTVKGTAIGTATSSNGSFTLSVPTTATTLVISSVGYTAQEVPLTSATNYAINMMASDETMTSVVVTVPYGTIRTTQQQPRLSTPSQTQCHP